MTILRTNVGLPTKSDFPLKRDPIVYCWRTFEWLKEQPTFLTDATKAKALYEHALTELCATYAAETAIGLWTRERNRPLSVPPELTPTTDDSRLETISSYAFARDRRENRMRRQVMWPGEWVDAAVRIPSRAWLTP